ncbi:MAG TPA: ATP-binding protein [Chloroflexia bacterium]|nr:ATP-binding protein [Chloroflexia bacterium]
MEAIIFTGLQASGKSSFYRQRFFDTHVRINLDMLRTRNRERVLLQACLEMKQPFVVDNTNPTPDDRARYIGPARQAGFRVVAYYFQPDLQGSRARNDLRTGKARVPVGAISGTAGRVQSPPWEEGFEAIYDVWVADGGFRVVERLREAGHQENPGYMKGFTG